MSFSVVLSAWLSVEMEIMAVNLLATSPSTSTLPPSPCVEDPGFPLSSLDSEDYVFVEERHPNKVLEGLNSLRLNNAFCDVTLCCGGQEFPCHRIVLASFSSYFQVTVIVSVKRLPSTFTFMHLADAFIQSDLQCIQAIHVLSLSVFPGYRTHNLLRC